MKLTIKNPAPLGPNQEKWGDFHFGRALSKYLSRLGAEVTTHYHEQWEQADPTDAVLVLRGKYRYRPPSSTTNILWCMSNPSTITVEECNEYDAVCVASTTHAAQLRNKTTVPVHALLQCTDPEEFEVPGAGDNRAGYIFVGNSRGVRRPCVEWAIEFGLNVEIYGRGWKDFGLQKNVAADYLDNEQLPILYGKSRLTLNDHWQDMRSMGYVNNRIFDCLAAGLPIVTDDFPELRAICGDELLYYNDRADLFSALNAVVTEYRPIIRRQNGLWRKIRDDYSFASRASFLLDLAKNHSNRKRSMPGKNQEGSSVLSRTSFDSGLLDVVREEYSLRPTGYYCPVCGKHSDAFRAGGVVKKRPNAKCPRCGALERHRLFWLYFVNDLSPRLPRRLKQLLHVAPEEHIARLLHDMQDINYLSGDLFMPNVMVKLDLTAIEFPKDRFDIVICSHILEHIPDDRKAMAEMLRVIKPGGYALIIVPLYGDTTYEDPSVTSPADRLREFGQEDHVRKYGTDIERRLMSVGFDVQAKRYRSSLDAGLAAYAALKDQVIYECRKPV